MNNAWLAGLCYASIAGKTLLVCSQLCSIHMEKFSMKMDIAILQVWTLSSFEAAGDNYSCICLPHYRLPVDDFWFLDRGLQAYEENCQQAKENLWTYLAQPGYRVQSPGYTMIGTKACKAWGSWSFLICTCTYLVSQDSNSCSNIGSSFGGLWVSIPSSVTRGCLY